MREHACHHLQDAAVMCQGIPLMLVCLCSDYFIVPTDNPVVSDCVNGDVRLVGGPTPLEGTVEVCRNKVWGGVCMSGFYNSDANVVCHQLGFQRAGNLFTHVSH